MTKIEASWTALQTALSTSDPACDGDDRFTQDDITEEMRAELLRLCRGCPVLSECSAYARRESNRRLTGFWGGLTRGRRDDRDRPE